MLFICAVAADFWCCLGSTSSDRTSDDYYYMSTNQSVANAAVSGINCSSENAVDVDNPCGSLTDDRPSCQADSSAGNDSAKGCDNSGESNSGPAADSSGGGCDSGGGFDSGGGCDSGGGSSWD